MTLATSALRATSVRIFLADGTPEGLRLVEKSNWTGFATMCSRVQYPAVRARSEFSRPCVYVLIGKSEEVADRQRLYIGQADTARDRLDQHVRDPQKEFWTHLILFTSKDSNLNRAHVQYLESKLIQLATKSKRADLANNNIPSPPSLSEADIADAESFLVDMLTIYPLLGVTAFEQAEPASQTETERPLLILKGPDTLATGRDTPSGFVVYAQSTGRVRTASGLATWGHALRKRLQEEGVIAEIEGKLVVKQDYTFDSPSAAAAVLLGRSANGRTEWADQQGRTLKSLQEAQLSPTLPMDEHLSL